MSSGLSWIRYQRCLFMIHFLWTKKTKRTFVQSSELAWLTRDHLTPAMTPKDARGVTWGGDQWPFTHFLPPCFQCPCLDYTKFLSLAFILITDTEPAGYPHKLFVWHNTKNDALKSVWIHVVMEAVFQAKRSQVDIRMAGWWLVSRTSTQGTGICISWETIINRDFIKLFLFLYYRE